MAALRHRLKPELQRTAPVGKRAGNPKLKIVNCKLIENCTLTIVVLALVAAAAPGCRDEATTGGKSSEKSQAVSTAATGKASDAAREEIKTLAKFCDLTSASGIDFTYRDGQEAGNCAILESLGGGAALFDYDGDGLLDVFLPGGGRYSDKDILGLDSALFHNDGELRFREVSATAGVRFAAYYSHGAAIGDYNGDGFADLLLTGYGGLTLFCNQGDGTFSETAKAAGLTDSLWSTSAGWADLDGDAVLDLYVAHYVDWSWDNDPYCEGPQKGQRDVCLPSAITRCRTSCTTAMGTVRSATSPARPGSNPRGRPARGSAS